MTIKLIGTYTGAINSHSLELEVANMEEDTILEALEDACYYYDTEAVIDITENSVKITYHDIDEVLYLETG